MPHTTHPTHHLLPQNSPPGLSPTIPPLPSKVLVKGPNSLSDLCHQHHLLVAAKQSDCFPSQSISRHLFLSCTNRIHCHCHFVFLPAFQYSFTSIRDPRLTPTILNGTMAEVPEESGLAENNYDVQITLSDLQDTDNPLSSAKDFKDLNLLVVPFLSRRFTAWVEPRGLRHITL